MVDITHYWLFKFLVEVKFLVGRQISSRSLVNVNCKYASEEIYPVLLKQQSIKSSTSESCYKFYHYLQSAKNSANWLILPKKLLNEVNYKFKTKVHKQLLKTLGTYLFCTTNQIEFDSWIKQLNLRVLYSTVTDVWTNMSMYMPLFNSKSYYII